MVSTTSYLSLFRFSFSYVLFILFQSLFCLLFLYSFTPPSEGRRVTLRTESRRSSTRGSHRQVYLVTATHIYSRVITDMTVPSSALTFTPNTVAISTNERIEARSVIGYWWCHGWSSCSAVEVMCCNCARWRHSPARRMALLHLLAPQDRQEQISSQQLSDSQPIDLSLSAYLCFLWRHSFMSANNSVRKYKSIRNNNAVSQSANHSFSCVFIHEDNGSVLDSLILVKARIGKLG